MFKIVFDEVAGDYLGIHKYFPNRQYIYIYIYGNEESLLDIY